MLCSKFPDDDVFSVFSDADRYELQAASMASPMKSPHRYSPSVYSHQVTITWPPIWWPGRGGSRLKLLLVLLLPQPSSLCSLLLQLHHPRLLEKDIKVSIWCLDNCSFKLCFKCHRIIYECWLSKSLITTKFTDCSWTVYEHRVCLGREDVHTHTHSAMSADFLSCW